MIWLNKAVIRTFYGVHPRMCSRENRDHRAAGQSDLLTPSLVAEGLAANDQVKVRLSVLQGAAARGRDPKDVQFNLMDECWAAGIDHVPLETLVNNAELLAGERLLAPGLGNLVAGIWDDMVTMIRAVKAGDAVQGDDAVKRLSVIQASAPSESSDTTELSKIAMLTALPRDENDSLHRLIMDLHKALNRLAAMHAEDVIAGAPVYGLRPEDRPAVEAFMRGLEVTRKLKFNHPDLATTVTRAGARLTIQNDIGETDAHVS